MYLRSQRNETSEMDAMGRRFEQRVDLSLPEMEMSQPDVDLLRRVVSALPLLADVSHADLIVYVRSGDRALVAAQATPTSVPPLYTTPLVGKSFTPDEAVNVHRALFSAHMSHAVRSKSVTGAPTIQETLPVLNQAGRLVAVVSSETNLLEYERRRKKNPIFRDAVGRLQQEVLSGKLAGTEQLTHLGEHYGAMVIDANARVLYISSLAEQLYRKLGYTSSLLGRKLSELDTSEHICFKALEREQCLEQRIDEHNLVWLKRVIPLHPEGDQPLLARFFVREKRGNIAIVLFEDITDEHRKEQALRIKSALIREIHHRVKNNLQTIAAILRMQARRTGSPEVLDMLKQSINRILSIALVHEFLSKDEAPGEEGTLISMREVSQRMLSEVTQGIVDPDKNIRISLEGTDFSLPPQRATSCALVINELLQNSVEHGFETKNDGVIRVVLSADEGKLMIDVVDTGEGLPEGFDMEKDGSLGLQIIQTLVREDLKGRFELIDNGGVHAHVSFPSDAAAPEPQS
ncbi:MAG TPA: histidine kinase N-terminal domain-containing protein [Chloroflexota bacterium]